MCVGAEAEYLCILCKTTIDATSNPGRVLTRATYDQYGLQPQENPADVRICQKCRLSHLKKRTLKYAALPRHLPYPALPLPFHSPSPS